jgi:hypothetical protein
LKTKIIKMKLKKISYIGLTAVLLSSCTKLDQKLQDSFTTAPGSNNNPDIAVLLNGCYNAFGGLVNNQDQLFSLEENTADECLVPTRGGDWDDNGVWRVLHAHTWTTIHGQFKSVFTGLGQAESNAITTLAFNPSQEQAAEALFLRSLAQFYYLDLFGQVPYRDVADYNSIDPAPVMQPAEAIDNLITTLTQIIPQLSAANSPHRASPDAARFLLMKVYLNKGAWLNKAAPTFDNGDMAKVIELGQEIMNSKNYSLTPEYFDNFGPQNASLGKEAILS